MHAHAVHTEHIQAVAIVCTVVRAGAVAQLPSQADGLVSLCLLCAAMSIPTAEALAQVTGYPILDVPIDQDLARCCGSESKFLAGVLKSFAKLEQKQVATPQDMSADESALLMKYKQSTTPSIIRVKCVHRSSPRARRICCNSDLGSR